MAFYRFSQDDALEELDRMLDENREEQLILLAGVMALRRRDRARAREQAARRPRRPRRWWVKPWVGGREVHSQFRNLFEELDEEFDEDYRGYVRLDRELFHEILVRIAPRITKSSM